MCAGDPLGPGGPEGPACRSPRRGGLARTFNPDNHVRRTRLQRQAIGMKPSHDTGVIVREETGPCQSLARSLKAAHHT